MEKRELIRLIRKSCDITQKEVAEKAEVTQSAVNQYEQGIFDLSLDALKRIALYLRINPDYISGKASTPFISKELYKLYIVEEKSTEGGIRPITDLLLLCRRVFVISLTIDKSVAPTYKILKKSPSAEPVYAVAIRDSEDNVFLVRRKKDNALILLEGGTQARAQQFYMPAYDPERVQSSFGKHRLDARLYQKIREWENIERNDIEVLFKKTKFTEFISPSDEEMKILLSMRKEENADGTQRNAKKMLGTQALNEMLSIIRDESTEEEKRKEMLKSIVSFYVARIKGVYDPNEYVRELKVAFSRFGLALEEHDVNELSNFLNDDVQMLIEK